MKGKWEWVISVISKKLEWRHDIQHENTQHNDTQHYGLICKNYTRHKWHSTWWHWAYFAVLIAIMLNAIVPGVILLSVMTTINVMLSIIMLSVVILNVVMLSVVASLLISPKVSLKMCHSVVCQLKKCRRTTFLASERVGARISRCWFCNRWGRFLSAVPNVPLNQLTTLKESWKLKHSSLFKAT